MSRTRRALLLCATLAVPTVVAAQAKQDTTGRSTARPASTAPAKRSAADTVFRATAVDRVGAADTTCDAPCRRERMMDSVYGKDRERAPATKPAHTRPTTPSRRP